MSRQKNKAKTQSFFEIRRSGVHCQNKMFKEKYFWASLYSTVNVIYIIHSLKEYIYNGLGSALSYRHYSVSFICIYHLFLYPHNMQMCFIFLEEETFISPCPSLFRKSVVFSIKAELLWSWDPLVVHYLIYR